MYGRDRDTTRWGEGNKVWEDEALQSAVRAVGNGVLQYDDNRDELVVARRKLGRIVRKPSPAVNTYADLVGVSVAFSKLQSMGCAVGTVSEKLVQTNYSYEKNIPAWL